MIWARIRPSLRDDDVWTILRVDNCSEVDLAGNSYKQDGKYYDDCCDLENEDAPECAEVSVWLIVGHVLGIVLIMGIVWVFLVCCCAYYGQIFSCFLDCVKTCCNKCYNTCLSLIHI